MRWLFSLLEVRSKSDANPLILRYSSEPNSMNLRFFPVKMGVSSSLVRRKNEE